MIFKKPELYQDPQIDDPIHDLNLNFADYINKTRKIIEKYHPNNKLASEANTPFILKPLNPVYSEKNPTQLKHGALLIHGLLDSPFMMKDIGKKLQAQGMLVHSILLPGHGTIPGALLNVKYEAWVNTVEYGITSLLKEAESIFLVGFSTGAMLSLYHVLQNLNSSHIAGLVMLCPAYKIKSLIDFTSNWHRTISWLWPAAQWFYTCDEINYAKYSSIPFNSIYQVYRLTKAIKKINHTREPNCPIFMGLTSEDIIVNTESAIQSFKNYSNSNNKMILYSQNPITFNDSRIIVKSSVYPEWKINNFCHISVPISPLNTHYGEQGDFPLASHIKETKNCEYGAYTKFQVAITEWLYRLGLVKYKKERLTFNPDFDYLMDEMEKFINSCK